VIIAASLVTNQTHTDTHTHTHTHRSLHKYWDIEYKISREMSVNITNK